MEQSRLEQILQTIKKPAKRITAFMLAAATLWTTLTATIGYAQNSDTETGRPKYRSEAVSHYNGNATLEERTSGKGTPLDTLWTRTFGGTNYDVGRSVQQTKDGGFIITGTTYSFGAGNGDVWLIRTDSFGDTLWAKTYGGTGYDEGYSVCQTSDDGFIISGYTKSLGTNYGDAYLIKTDSNGDTLWTRTYGGAYDEYGWAVQQTFDDGFIITGWTGSFGAGKEDAYLIKTDANGDTLWTRTYGGAVYDWSYSVKECADSGFIIAGETGESGSWDGDAYLIKTDANGDTLWTRTYGGSDWERGYSVMECNDKGFIIVGKTWSFGHSAYLIKTDGNGNTMWTKTFGEDDDGCGYSVCQTSDDGFIVAGSILQSRGTNKYDVYLVRTNSSGNTLWTKTFGGTDHDWGYSVMQISDGGYILAGYTKRSTGEVYLIRLGKEPGIEEKLIPEKDNIWLKPTVGNGIFATNYKGRVDAYNITGKKVLSQNSDGVINLEEMASGIYFLKLKDNNITKKITKIP